MADNLSSCLSCSNRLSLYLASAEVGSCPEQLGTVRIRLVAGRLARNKLVVFSLDGDTAGEDADLEDMVQSEGKGPD